MINNKIGGDIIENLKGIELLLKKEINEVNEVNSDEHIEIELKQQEDSRNNEEDKDKIIKDITDINEKIATKEDKKNSKSDEIIKIEEDKLKKKTKYINKIKNYNTLKNIISELSRKDLNELKNIKDDFKLYLDFVSDLLENIFGSVRMIVNNGYNPIIDDNANNVISCNLEPGNVLNISGIIEVAFNSQGDIENSGDYKAKIDDIRDYYDWKDWKDWNNNEDTHPIFKSPTFSDILSFIKDGENITILSYGPSGSGKTYTLIGNKEKKGLIPKLIEEIKTDNNYKVELSNILESYNDNFISLYNNDDKKKFKFPIINENNEFNYNKEDIVDLFNILEKYRKNKGRIKATPLNENSSRSHLFLVYKISNLLNKTFNYLTVIDFGGSENFININALFLGKYFYEQYTDFIKHNTDLITQKTIFQKNDIVITHKFKLNRDVFDKIKSTLKTNLPPQVKKLLDEKIIFINNFVKSYELDINKEYDNILEFIGDLYKKKLNLALQKHFENHLNDGREIDKNKKMSNLIKYIAEYNYEGNGGTHFKENFIHNFLKIRLIKKWPYVFPTSHFENFYHIKNIPEYITIPLSIFYQIFNKLSEICDFNNIEKIMDKSGKYHYNNDYNVLNERKKKITSLKTNLENNLFCNTNTSKFINSYTYKISEIILKKQNTNKSILQDYINETLKINEIKEEGEYINSSLKDIKNLLIYEMYKNDTTIDENKINNAKRKLDNIPIVRALKEISYTEDTKNKYITFINMRRDNILLEDIKNNFPMHSFNSINDETKIIYGIIDKAKVGAYEISYIKEGGSSSSYEKKLEISFLEMFFLVFNIILIILLIIITLIAISKKYFVEKYYQLLIHR